MPIIFTREEIRQFLKEEGYEVSDEKTLDKFIHDFKKLIKYEEMKRRRRKLGHPPDETVLDSTDERHPHTTTTSTQETSASFEDDHPNRIQKSPRHMPPSASKKSPSKSPSPRRRPVSKVVRSPVRPHKKQQEESGETQSYGTDETSSYRNNDSVDNYRKPQSATRPVVSSIASAPAKKQGNRLIMKRLTAVQAANGNSVIEESDIDLGPRRPGNKRPTPGLARPQTAPASRGGKLAIASKQPFQRAAPRPQSARSQQHDEKGEEDPCEPDELFHALNELIFPSDQIDSQDSLFMDSDRQKTLLKPPPHVARDPVLLYHWYKTYNWDVYTIPGEDRHMKLRWNVRAKTVGGFHPCVEARNFYKPKSYCC